MSKQSKPGVAKGALIRVCPGGRHAWYSSGFGPMRKPYKGENWKKG